MKMDLKMSPVIEDFKRRWEMMNNSNNWKENILVRIVHEYELDIYEEAYLRKYLGLS